MINYFSKLWDNSESERNMQDNVINHFMALEGLNLDYYGADSGDHTFNIDKIVFKVLEDPDDGYRSHLGPIDYSETHSSLFFNTPIARVRIEEFNDTSSVTDDTPWASQMDRGYRLVDLEDGHIWLEFGTGNYDDYYPYFMFRHYPKGEE